MKTWVTGIGRSARVDPATPGSAVTANHPLPPRRLAGAMMLMVLCLALATACERPAGPEPGRRIAGGNADSGKLLVGFYGCGACHTIPGMRDATGVVGPPLTRFALRSYIAGAVPNQPDHLVSWLVDPQVIEPGTAMPDLGLSQPEARDIAAYLYTLR